MAIPRIPHRRGVRIGGAVLLSAAFAVSAALGHGAGVLAHKDGEPGVCKDCQPPLLIHDGAVMGTAAAPGTVTITPIYWAPPGTDFSSNTGFSGLVNQYITDLAASSATDTNSVRVTSEYTNAATTPMAYNITANIVGGTGVQDTDALPTGVAGCTPDTGYTVCVSDAQLQAELSSLLGPNGLNLPADLADFYPVFFAPGVETKDNTGAASCGVYLGYHGAFDANGGTIVYGNEPYLPDANCGLSGQSPNNNPQADAVISVFDHELSEAMTDPTSGTGKDGWTDAKGNEIGDECNFDFGSALGGDTTAGTAYNQTINGHTYYAQREFSNAAYKANGVGNGCIQTTFAPAAMAELKVRERRLQTAGAATADNPTAISLDASPQTLPADGASTSTITLTALDANGDPVAGDQVLVFTHENPGALGTCGTLSGTSDTFSNYYDGVKDTTDQNGQVQVTYTASHATDECYVMATDYDAGRTDGVMIYQGADGRMAPSVQQRVPSTTITRGQSFIVTTTATNPTRTAITDARFDLALFGDNSGGLGLQSSQVSVFYRDAATAGRYLRATLDGTTADDGEIDAYIPPDAAQILPAGSTTQVQFEVIIAAGAPTTATTGKQLTIETDLDQYSPSDGSTTNLDYADSDLTVK